MTDPSPSEDITVSSDRSLKKLAWAIETSGGQFKLILARCNYGSLRSRLMERLQELCSVEIRVLVLKESDRTLYATIRAALGEDVPAALMVLGLESVRNLEQVLTSSNQVREEFRKNLPFPLVLWVNDEVLKNLMRLASDFESWATTVTFVIAPEDLENQLRDTAERQQQEPKLNELMAELEAERKQRKLSDAKLNQFLRRALMGSVAAMFVLVILTAFAVKSALEATQQKKRAENSALEAQEQKKQAENNEIEALSNSSEALFVSNRTFNALIESLKAGGKLKQAHRPTVDLQIQVTRALQQAVYDLREDNDSKGYSTMRERNSLEGHRSSVTSVSFSPDGKTLATGSADHTVKLWNREGQLLKTLTGHSIFVNSVSFSPDGKTLASGSRDNTVKLWSREGQLLKTLPGNSIFVNSVSFSPDGKTLASAGAYDHTVKLWNLEGQLLKTLTGNSSFVTSVSFSPDGKTLASASIPYNRVILWNLDLNDLLKQGCNWLNDYLVTHPDVLKELKACQTQSIFVKAAPAVVAQGEELARQGNREDAVATFRKALKWNPNLKLEPEAKAKPLADASDLVEKGQNLVQEGKFEDAVADFQRALKLDPDLDFEIKTKANSALVMKGESLVKEGKVKEAHSAYTQAQKLAPNVEVSAYSWNSLCKYGSPRGYAADVMFACEKAVALAPDNGDIRDGRGLARALTGNTKGAIEDFQAFIAKTDDQKLKAQRQRWVNALRAGKNPFTSEDIKSLLNQ